MKNFLISLITSTIVVVVGLYVFYNWIPLFSVNYLEKQDEMLGVSLTSLVGTDTMSDFPTLYNANNTLLNNGKIEVSTSSMDAITSLINLGVTGTITTGTWTASVIDSAYGGSGSSSWPVNKLLLGSSTNPFGLVDGTGASGQFLTSQGTEGAPYWSTAAVDQALGYSWTGLHQWSGASASITNTGTTTLASTTITNLNVLTTASTSALILPYGTNYSGLIASTSQTGTQIYSLPTSDGLAGQFLKTQGNGHLVFGSSTTMYFDDTTIYNDLAAPSSYTYMALSPYIGTSTSLVMLRVAETDGTQAGVCSFKPNGDASNYGVVDGGVSMVNLDAASVVGTVITKTDANSGILWKCAAAQEVTITLIGYWQ